ncbi:MAG: ABC transporter permease [Lachnospiraceae bacterium]|nr:ABC transporter permease [Lachnospiraceae bacterium]
MSNVNNKKAIRKLSLSGIKTNIKKYIVLIFAVALTSLMFTALFTIAGSLIKETQLATMRQVGGSSHAGFKYMTSKEYDMIKDDPKLKSIFYRITVGDAANLELNKLHTEVNYFEPEDARDTFCYPEVGQMPEKEDEIVTSDLVLERLGVPKEVGSKVPLTINIGDDEITKDFVLSGYYRGDIISSAQMILVSKAFQEKYAPVKTTPLNELAYNDYVGWIMADFNFDNAFNIKEKVDALIERTGIRKDIDAGYNWAYMGENFDMETAVIVCVLLFTVFLSGYLIIYNIFYINVISDIREYGLLKTIGTTGRQLKRIVRKRAGIISLIGIPLGILPGIGIGIWLLPIISDQINTVNVNKGQAHLNVWIILGAAAFSYITVIISANKPCKKAGSVSPIEALRTTENDGEKNNHSKKWIVILSLSLSLVILNSVFSIVKGFSMDNYIASLAVADYSIQEARLDNPGVYDKVLDGVTEDFLNALQTRDGVEDIGNVYIYYGFHTFDDADWEKIYDRILTDERVKNQMSERYTGENGIPNAEEMMEQYNKDKYLDGATYGIGKMVLDKLDVIKTVDGSKEIDWEKFNSGQYVLVNCWKDEESEGIPYFEPGEKVNIQSCDEKYVKYDEIVTEEGEKIEIPDYSDAPYKEYEVLAVVDIPYAIGLQMFGEFQCDFILPEEEFLEFNGERQPMRTLINVEDDKEEAFEAWVDNYTNSVDKNLDYVSKQKVVKEYDSFNKMLELVGVVLSLVLGIIGLLNFANTMITSIIVRAREMAGLEAVGMTGKQQKAKLIREGLIYFLWTSVVSVIIAGVLNATVIRMVLSESWMFTWSFTILPVIMCLPIICVLIIIIPCIAYERMRRVSVVERLRVE